MSEAGSSDQKTDFVIEEQTVYGLTAAGLKHLQQNAGRLVLPATDSAGKPILRVASFAFHPDKSAAIDDYVGRPGENGEINSLDVDGRTIKKLGVDFSNTVIRSVKIPAGYVEIGQDAFAFNRSLQSIDFSDTLEKISDYAFAHTVLQTLNLPNSLRVITDQAFFDNQISGTLTLPRNLKSLGERVFKGNRIENINFNGAPLTELKEAVFEDNNLRTINISTDLTQVAADAFNANPGSKEYGNMVVLRTPGGNNPRTLPNRGNYLVDPGLEHKTTPIDINTDTWEENDFTYAPITGSENWMITGFSDTGKLKISENKNLVLPATHSGNPVTKIGADAFRNVSLDGKVLKKYDLESVEFPPALTEIGDFAFQSNRLSELLLDPDLPLEKIGAGAFMNNQITDLMLPDSVTYIGDAAFHINQINVVVIPRETVYLGRSAFRQNNIDLLLGFAENAKLQVIGEMAFAQSHVENVDLSNAGQLREIGVQAFADNQISALTLPASLESIGPQAFAKNQLSQVKVPKALREITFNAFDNNPGMVEYDNKVLITLPADVTKTNLADGTNFVIDSRLKTSTVDRVKTLVEKLRQVDKESLRPETFNIIDQLLQQGEKLVATAKTNGISQGERNRWEFEAGFFAERIALDQRLKQAAEALAARVLDGESDPNSQMVQSRKLLQEAYDYADKNFSNAAWSAEKLARITRELALLTDLVRGEGEMSRATLVQGVHELTTSLPIPSYFIGLNVYVNAEGKILLVLDRSYTIGEGQNDEWGNPISNVDEDNEGYHQLALETLPDYEGKYLLDLLTHTVDTIGGIRETPSAVEHRAGIYAAMVDAAKDYQMAKDAESAGASDKKDETKPGDKINDQKPTKPGAADGGGRGNIPPGISDLDKDLKNPFELPKPRYRVKEMTDVIYKSALSSTGVASKQYLVAGVSGLLVAAGIGVITLRRKVALK